MNPAHENLLSIVCGADKTSLVPAFINAGRTMFADCFGPSHKAGGRETDWFDAAASKQTNQTMKTTKNSFRSVTGLTAGVLTGAVLSGLAPAPAQAQDATKPEDKGWESSAAVGLTISGGNSKSFQSTLTANSSRKWSKDEALLGAQAGFGESTVVDRADGEDDEKNTTEAYIKGFGQWNHLFTDRFYGGLRLDAVNDAISDIDYRFTLSPLAGYYFIKSAATTLAIEFGPSLVCEKVGGEDDTYAGLRLAERFEHKFTTGSRIWQSTEIVPEIDDFGNFIATSEIGAEAPLSKKLSLRLVFQHVYDSKPAKAGEFNGDTFYKLKNDTKLIGALAYKF